MFVGYPWSGLHATLSAPNSFNIMELYHKEVFTEPQLLDKVSATLKGEPPESLLPRDARNENPKHNRLSSITSVEEKC